MPLFSKFARTVSPLAPDRPFWAVGDIHGRADLLESLAERMVAEAPGIPAVFVGDFVDRGDDSAAVLQLLASGRPDGAQPVHCLMGNHEAMLLGFVDDPEGAGPFWLRNGGLQTLASFGVGGLTATPPRAALLRARDQLIAAMGPDLLDWVRGLPLSWRSGNVAVVHAAADPERPIGDQRQEVLLWGHPLFRRQPRSDGVWIVHGHTIVDEPLASDGRIAIDTGAFATGRLTAALVSNDAVRFIST